MTPCYTLEQFLSRLTELTTRDGNATTARALGVSPQYLCDVRSRRKGPSTKLLTAMGYEWRIGAASPTSEASE